MVRREVVRGGAWVEIEALHTPTVNAELSSAEDAFDVRSSVRLAQSYSQAVAEFGKSCRESRYRPGTYPACGRDVPSRKSHTIRGFSQGAAVCAALS